MNLPPFRLERFFARYEFHTRYLLSASDCQSRSIDELLALEPGAREGFLQMGLGYTESAGAPELRQQIAQLYPQLHPDQVLVHAGAEEAILLYMMALLGPADHAVVMWPGYQSLSEVAQSLGCEVTPWKLRVEQGNWQLSLDELEAALRPNTRLIVINTPHNPTGYQMDRATFDGVLQLAAQRGLRVFSDEVYGGLEYRADQALPPACTLYERATSLGVMSKTYGLPGLRIGWVATHDDAVRQRMAELKDYTSICNSGPSEYLATVALRHHTTLAQQNLALVRENLHLLEAVFARHADRLEWVAPGAGPIAFPRLKGGIDAEPWCIALAEQHGVLLLPGGLYGPELRSHFRVGFGRRNLPQALEAFEQALLTQ